MDVVVKADEKAMNRFHSALRELQRLSGKDFETVIKAEVGAVITRVVKETPKATKKGIEANHANRTHSKYDISYTPQRGAARAAGPARSRKYVKSGKYKGDAARRRALTQPKTYNLKYKYPAQLWEAIQAKRQAALANRLAARGMAASAIVKIADMLKLPVKAAKYIRGAKSKKGNTAADFVQVVEVGKGNSYRMGFVNRLTGLNKALGLGLIFRQALHARANYFSQSLKLQAKKKIKSVMQRYPGLAKGS